MANQKPKRLTFSNPSSCNLPKRGGKIYAILCEITNRFFKLKKTGNLSKNNKRLDDNLRK